MEQGEYERARVILVGVDESVTAHRAAWYAVGLPRRQGASLVWVYVAPPATLTAADIAAGGVLAAERAVHDEIAEELGTRAAEAAREFEVQLVFMTLCGDPYREITRIAGETKADAIMVGASLKAGHRLMGSLGVRLVRAGKWPVTVVP